MTTIMTGLTSRIFEGHNVRFLVSPEGEPLFVAKDVCDILGIANARDAVSRLPEKHVSNVGSSDVRDAPNRGLNVVTEPGLYRLIFQSRKPEAERFTDWVTEEVLPSVRKTGSYSLPGHGVLGDTHPAVRRLRAMELQMEAQRLIIRAESLGQQARAALAPPPVPEGFLTIAQHLAGLGVRPGDPRFYGAASRLANRLRSLRLEEGADYVWTRKRDRKRARAYRRDLLDQTPAAED